MHNDTVGSHPGHTASAASPELEADGPGRLDVATCVREARQHLASTSPAMNALTVGHRSAQLQTALAPVREAIYRATCADLGVSPDDPERPTEALRITARNLATLDVLVETFWTWIEVRGVLTAKGKTRSAVTTLLSIVDRQQKVIGQLGLARKARTVADLSLEEYVNLHRPPREQQPQQEAEP